MSEMLILLNTIFAIADNDEPDDGQGGFPRIKNLAALALAEHAKQLDLAGNSCAECGGKNIENAVVLDTNFYLKNHKPCYVPIRKCKDCGFAFWDDLFGDIASKIIAENENVENETT
ncbi:unnamed protein product [marine sediment metagenome]|uniref:Uncharacterized protein n=1 Tax=marine sediment metagenome TaxID=412755 RepID=X1CLK6_9ZZZZ